jgi:uncharacterized protein
MMVIFQNKIIYMPSVPPFSRSETVKAYAVQCRPVTWKEHDLRAADGTVLKLLEGSIESASKLSKRVNVLYFQGNASSLPPRLPYLSAILKTLQATDVPTHHSIKYTIFALSYRGFWTSRGRATQPGIELDAQAALQWLSDNTFQHEQATEVKTIIWGQSIGAGVATTAVATLLTQQALNENAAASSSQQLQKPHHQTPPLNIHTLSLETPFLSIRSMLVALYPQKFLPYRHLWPFLRSTWDSEAAIKKIALATTTTPNTTPTTPTPTTTTTTTNTQPSPPILPQKILILQAGHDEIVPAAQSEVLERVCRENLAAVTVARVVIPGALHTDVMAKMQGRRLIVQQIRDAVGGV